MPDDHFQASTKRYATASHEIDGVRKEKEEEIVSNRW